MVDLRAFPAGDQAFRAHIESAMAIHGSDLEAVQVTVREAYPRAVLRLRSSLGQLGTRPSWYAYRDGYFQVDEPESAWWEDPDVARTRSSGEGTYAEANGGAARLFGVSIDSIVGSPIGSFTTHANDQRLTDHLRGELERTGRLHSTAILRARPGVTIEFVTVRMDSGDLVTCMREQTAGAAMADGHAMSTPDAPTTS